MRVNSRCFCVYTRKAEKSCDYKIWLAPCPTMKSRVRVIGLALEGAPRLTNGTNRVCRAFGTKESGVIDRYNK